MEENGMTLPSQNLLVKCRGRCGKQVDKDKFGELCRDCWTLKKRKAVQRVAVNDKPQDPAYWHRGWTMCLLCHEQVRTIRSIVLHYHLTAHLEIYSELTDEEKAVKKREREEALKYDQYEGDEKRATF